MIKKRQRKRGEDKSGRSHKSYQSDTDRDNVNGGQETRERSG